jgi:predicted DNA binding CopG/RHH family protein
MRNSKMEIDTEDEDTNAQKFRDYAAECRRLARAASGADRAVLIEIAEAWILCVEQAEQAEREVNRRRQ